MNCVNKIGLVCLPSVIYSFHCLVVCMHHSSVSHKYFMFIFFLSLCLLVFCGVFSFGLSTFPLRASWKAQAGHKTHDEMLWNFSDYSAVLEAAGFLYQWL